MEALTALLGAIAKLLWPLIAIAVVLIFRPAVHGLIESARSRRFTLKIGGQELTMDEANEQQRLLIADLQSQLAELRKRVDGSTPRGAPAAIANPASAFSPTSVLWVDDRPKNNSYFIEELSRLGVHVDLALTTADGISRFRQRRYDVLISDMGRREGGRHNPTAGLDLLKEVRELDPDIPFMIFCSSRAVREHGAEAGELGATGVTASASELYALLGLERLKDGA